MAALYLVTLPSEEKLKAFEAHAESDRFDMVWRFVFGLGCNRYCTYSRKVISLDNKVVDQFLTMKNNKRLLLHCLVESMDDIVSSKIMKEINGQFEQLYSSIANTPNDCETVFHALRHASGLSNIKINLSFCGLTDKLLSKLADILASAGGKLLVRQLKMCGNKITGKGIADLFNRVSASFSSLCLVEVDSNCITNVMSPYSSCKSITSLFISNNPLGVSGIQSLEAAIQAGVLVNLKKLCLSKTLTDDSDINGALLTMLLPSIASHCFLLQKLNLSRNNLGLPGATALGDIIFSEKSELELDLGCTNICAEAVAAFNMSGELSQCDYSLNIKCNRIGYNGLLAILRLLRSETCPITTLDLTNTDLTTPVSCAVNLGPALESSRLTQLYLSSNNFSGDKVLLLAECMQVCKSLDYLFCWRCALTSTEVIYILDYLTETGDCHKNLCVWSLLNNSIDDKGVNALIKRVPQLFPSLEDVNLLDNPVSGDVMNNLKKILQVSSISNLVNALYCRV